MGGFLQSMQLKFITMGKSNSFLWDSRRNYAEERIKRLRIDEIVKNI